MSNRKISADLLLVAYAQGIFPMAETRDDPNIYWVDPERRGIIPLETFHAPRRLMRTVKAGTYRVTIDTEFERVMRECSLPRPGQPESWISEPIMALYCELHRRGHAHSIETRDAGGALVGGLYGVKLGAAFFGESMFSRATDASKVALVHLVARLRAGGFTLLDTQFQTAHLAQFGTVEIARREYRRRLAAATTAQADFYRLPSGADGALVLQSITQTS